MKKGFTLIELLVSISLMAIIGTVTVSIVSTVLRSSSKTTLAVDIRQSGNNVLQQLSDTVRYATAYKLSVDPNPFPAKNTTVCPAPPTSFSYLQVTEANNSVASYYCDNTSITYEGPGAATYVPMIDTSSIQFNNCALTCSESNTDSAPIINIKFTLSQKGTGSFAENNVSLPFTTSILMRNIH